MARIRRGGRYLSKKTKIRDTKPKSGLSTIRSSKGKKKGLKLIGAAALGGSFKAGSSRAVKKRLGYSSKNLKVGKR